VVAAGEDGHFYRVEGIYKQGLQPCYALKFSDGTTIVCDKSHLWNIQTRNMRDYRKDRFKTVTMSELLQTDLCKVDKKLNCKEWNVYIPMCKPVEYAEKNYPYEPYYLGLLLGDGCFANNYIGFSNTEEDILNYCRNYYVEGGIKGKFKPMSEKNPNGIDWEIVDCYLEDRLRKWRLWDKRSHEKFIPRAYKYGSVKQRTEMLQGIIDTDGWVDGSSASYSSSSKQLADDVQHLVTSLGGTAKLSVEDSGYKKDGVYIECKKAYVLEIKMPYAIECFSSVKHSAKFKKGQSESRRTLREIVPVGSQETICLRTANPSGLFLTENHVVTHNTSLIADCCNDERTSPILVLDCEGGAPIRFAKQDPTKYTILNVTSISELSKYFNYLATQKHPYKAIALDSVTALQKVGLHYFAEGDKYIPLEDRSWTKIKQAEIQHWGKSLNQMLMIMQNFRDLPLHTFFTTLSQRIVDETTKKITVTVQLPGQQSTEIPGIPDIVGYIDILKGKGGLQRVLKVQPDGTVDAKDRTEALGEGVLLSSSGNITKILDLIWNKYGIS
jgi:hypothetical protein